MLTQSAFYSDVNQEVMRAIAKHGKLQWGRHEFYAILKEEVDELWDAVKRDEPQHIVEKETIQVAAMCMRYLTTGDRYREPVQQLPCAYCGTYDHFTESPAGERCRAEQKK